MLIPLLTDEDVQLHAISALRRLRAAEARPALEALLTDHHGPVRRRARAALDRLRMSPGQGDER
ncbi:hypothetical protein Ade02nite_80920 [Paractinoplanes deccanensis]|uniref:HEAT repeat domain-containing protein n=1 Tax=Paractinoplanes deccanensis TaxID=113561 RepID=A0ABQ3YHH9_9ACTN|nr:HEAT repeat domain-containing protein [Actinoplanes deccanensis]GID79451.1 hypothetical protein Ade02nite_80920 [Actinoplanes deccanensis]